jgi:hypothetical protein
VIDRRHKMKCHIAIPLVLIASLLAACSSSSGVYGQVTDGESGGPLPGISVELSECSESGCDEVLSSQVTDEDGRYAFPDAPAGKYMLSILWESAPECPGMSAYAGLGRSGDFLVSYIGYGGLGGLRSTKSILAISEFELGGRGKKLDLELGCP